VLKKYKINSSRFGNESELSGDSFGISVANLGDLDNDGVQDIAVGEYGSDDGGFENGAVWILFLNTSGGVKNEYKINSSRFGNGSELSGDYFGNAVANLGDLDNDGIQDIAVGEHGNDDGGTSNGAVWILFLNTSGGVKNEYKINSSRFGNESELTAYDLFGYSVANLGDLDNDGVQDIVVGELYNGDGGYRNGAVWILFLNTSGGVKDEYKINESRFGNGNELSGGYFGYSVANLGDLDNDGVQDLVVGEYLNGDGGNSNGAVWIMFLNTSGGVKSEYKINELRFGNGNELDGDRFGSAVANLGDLDNDGVQDIAVGEYGNDDGGYGNGAVWILFLGDSTSPIYNMTDWAISGTNKSGSVFYFNVTWNDSGNLDSWIIASNQSGSWVNHTISDSWVNKVGDWYIAVMNFTITAVEGTVFTVMGYANDTSGNLNFTWGGSGYGGYGINLVVSVLDGTAPGIDFTLPTPANGTTTSNTSIEINFSIDNAADLDEVIYNWNGSNFTLYDDSLVLMMNFDNVSSLGENESDVVDVSGHCYDDETEVMTDSGWKYFWELDGSEKVMTLNAETGEMEYQKPMERQIFDYNKDMYKINLVDNNGKEGELVVSEKHRVYSGSENLSFVSPIMMVEINNFNNTFFDVDLISKNIALEDMDSPFTSEFVFQRLEMFRVFKNRCNLSRECFVKFPVFGAGFSYPFFNTFGIFENHFLQNSSFDVVLNGPFSASETLLTNSSLYSSSSTGCQSICSQNSQSSSVTSPFSLYLLNISCFRSLTKALVTNSESNFNSLIDNCAMLGDNEKEYINFSINYNLKPITEVYSSFNNGEEVWFLDDNRELVRVKNISKKKYDKMIYDVDVENDIILVRRKSDNKNISNVIQDKNDESELVEEQSDERAREAVGSLVLEDTDINNEGEDNYIAVWSGNSNNGTWTGGQDTNSGVNCTDAKYGCARMFDGSGDYVDCGNDSVLNFIPNTDEFTLSSWINIVSGQDGSIIAKGPSTTTSRQYQIFIQDGGDELRGRVGGTEIQSGVDVADGTWHHIIGVNYDDSGTKKFKFYIDGIADDTIITSGSATNSLDVLIGARRNSDNTDSGFEFNGLIDEVLIYNRSLSANEIYQLYVSNLHKYDTDKWSLYINQSLNATDGLDDGNYTYFASAKDNTGNLNMTDVRSFTVEAEDTEYPLFSNYWDNNATLTCSGTGHFNVTITSTNATVFLEINNTNITASNVTATVFNASAVFTLNGTYTYKWHSWGNGTDENYNVSAERSYTVNVTPVVNITVLYPDDLSVNFNATQNEFFNVTLNVSCLDGNCGVVNVSLDPESSEGPNLPGSGVEDQTVGGTEWAAYNNVLTDVPNGDSGDWVGNFAFADAVETYYIKATNYSFSIPETATITGIKVDVNCKTGAENLWEDNSVRLVMGGSIVGDDKVKNEALTTTMENVTYGGTGQLWGLTPTATQINANDFGVVYSAISTSAGFEYIYVNTIRVIVYYEEAEAKGLINTTIGATPFYTNASTNPLSTSSLSKGESEIITFWVNATGTVNNNYTFFAYANLTSDLSISNISNKWNVSINSAINNVPVVSTPFAVSPANPTTIDDLNCSFAVVDVDAGDNLTANVTWYKDNIANFTINYSVITDVSYDAILDSGNTSYNENWSCSVQPYDGEDWGVQKNSSNGVFILDFNLTVNLLFPTNGLTVSLLTQYFAANYTDYDGLKNATLYIWNSTGVVNNTENRTISGTSDSSNISIILPRDDTYYWNYYACDVNNNCFWNNTNWSVNVDETVPNVNITYPVNGTTYTINVNDLNYTYSDDNPGYCWYSNDGGAWNIVGIQMMVVLGIQHLL